VIRSAGSGAAGVIAVILLYILLIVLILFFSDQILQDIAEEGTLSIFIIIPLAAVLPLFLLGIIGVNILNLIKERARGNPGAKFKTRLIIFFTFIAFLSSIPQGILSMGFINTTMNSWFSSRLADALQGGLDIALEYYNEKIENLTTFSESNVFPLLLRDMTRQPDQMWDNIRSANPSVHSIQIFDNDGNEVLFKGDTRTRIQEDQPGFQEEGVLPKETKKDASILRILKKHSIEGRNYSIILSVVLPRDFDTAAEQLTSSLLIFKEYEKYQSTFRIVLILFFSFFSFPILLLSILISFILTEEIIRPIVSLEEATKKVAEGDFSIRILSRSRDELAILIDSFNQMVSELERSRIKIMQTEKVTAWQEIAQRMAHEIKNPLTPIKLSAQRILRKYKTDINSLEKVLEPSVNSIILEVDNLTKLLQEFRDFARLPAPYMQPSNLKSIVAEASSMYQASYPLVTLHIEDIDDNLMLNVDRNQIKQVFSNLLKNAFEAIESEGEVFIRTDLVRKGNLKYCRIQVRDTGSGIDEENRNKVFNPYFTTKKRGTGLGLSIVERIIFDHNGQIWFETEKEMGTTFFIDLPMEG